MPYIAPEDRVRINRYLSGPHYHKNDKPQNCGELNYAITLTAISPDLTPQGKFAALRKIAMDYLAREPLRYQRINDVHGAFHCAVLELERRAPGRFSAMQSWIDHLSFQIYEEIAAPYEDTKIKQNGDIAY